MCRAARRPISERRSRILFSVFAKKAREIRICASERRSSVDFSPFPPGRDERTTDHAEATPQTLLREVRVMIKQIK